jgi:hypothetical protein
MNESTFSIKDIDTLRYRPTVSAEDFLSDLRSRLGLLDKATAARLAMARSLHEGAVAVADARGSLDHADRGTAIQGMHLFGEDTAAWATALAFASGDGVELASDFRLLAEYHWHRGAGLLERDWSDAEGDVTVFVTRLAGRLGVGAKTSTRGPSAPAVGTSTRSPVRLQVLREQEPWEINAAGGNGLVVISGKPGRGKSQLAFDMLAQAAAQGVRVLFFDLKGELEPSEEDAQKQRNREEFLAAIRADYVRLIQSRLPINPLAAGSSGPDQAQIAAEFAHLARCYASQLGANQEKEIRDAYVRLKSPDIDGLVRQLEGMGASGVGLSIVDKLRSFGVFEKADRAEPIESWLSTSRVIDMKGLGNDTSTKSLIVAFILNAVMRQLNRQLPVENGVQPLQAILFVDEAHLILPNEGKAGLLGTLARQGRSWGFPLWLASQDADAFITRGANAVDFAQLADCGIHLSPETLTAAQQKTILGQTISRPLAQGEGLLRLKGEVTTGQIRQFFSDRGTVVSPD